MLPLAWLLALRTVRPHACRATLPQARAVVNRSISDTAPVHDNRAVSVRPTGSAHFFWNSAAISLAFRSVSADERRGAAVSAAAACCWRKRRRASGDAASQVRTSASSPWVMTGCISPPADARGGGEDGARYRPAAGMKWRCRPCWPWRPPHLGQRFLMRWSIRPTVAGERVVAV